MAAGALVLVLLALAAWWLGRPFDPRHPTRRAGRHAESAARRRGARFIPAGAEQGPMMQAGAGGSLAFENPRRTGTRRGWT
ncbi:MAG: hypothetical protein ACLSVD_04045 [Eggerthellaceae bacterium]